MAALPASAAPGLAIAVPDAPSALEHLLDRHRTALAASDVACETFRQLEVAMDEAGGSGQPIRLNLDGVEYLVVREEGPMPAADEHMKAAEEAENDALEALLLHRPTTVSELAAKALYLALIVDRGGTMIGAVDTERAQRFLRSLA
ncbi:hypothetical protein [Mesorhizobium sp.]|uniref:hypothetical protein n=1 Tax=Mesorhizobium sp. TaxID=1871066 RepID=UPI0012144D35|nr:hypothetical protein [Mesorhizobium sp.]TIL50463.1 MAG: hypothetical protein E5Y83_21825 [Mesorhizobium sp.]